MKNILLIFAILCLLPLSIRATTDYLDGDDGNDSNGGTGWMNGIDDDAWATLGKLNTETPSAGDTAACVGTFTETLAPNFSGTSGNEIVLIDSLRYDSYNIALPLTEWSAIIDGESTRSTCITLSNVDYVEIKGFDLTGATSESFDMSFQCEGVTINQNRLENCDIAAFTASTTNFTSNLVLGGSLEEPVDIEYRYGTINIYNNTIYTNDNSAALYLDNQAGDSLINIKNNVIQNISGSAGGGAARLQGGSEDNIGLFDYNIYYNAAASYKFYWGGWMSTFAAWEDSVNNYDTTSPGEANSSFQDPSLENTGTICDWTDGDPPDEFCADSDVTTYGTDAGWYQDTEAAGGGGSTNSILQIIKNWKSDSLYIAAE